MLDWKRITVGLSIVLPVKYCIAIGITAPTTLRACCLIKARFEIKNQRFLKHKSVYAVYLRVGDLLCVTDL
jgi:hypothetical protein